MAALILLYGKHEDLLDRLRYLHACEIIRDLSHEPKITNISWLQTLFIQEGLNPLKQLPAQVPTLHPAFLRHRLSVLHKRQFGVGFGQSKDKSVHSIDKKVLAPCQSYCTTGPK